MQFAYDTSLPVVLRNASRTRPLERPNVIRNETRIGAASPIVLHLGQLRHGRGCEHLLQSFVNVPNANLVFLGSGPLDTTLRRQAESLGLRERIHFMMPVPSDEVLDYAASADIGVVLLEDSCLNHHFALPNKLFEYLAANVPVLASDLPELRRIVRRYDVGLMANPGDPNDIARKLNQMLSDPDRLARWKRNSHRAVETFESDATSERFVQVIQDLLNTGS